MDIVPDRRASLAAMTVDSMSSFSGQKFEPQTKRIWLRQWRDEDLDPMAKICADPDVMKFLSANRDRETTSARMAVWSSHISEHGWGFWAAELKQTRELIGFIGMAHLDHDHPFAPGVELGWRLAKRHWNQGYATEGGRACLKVAFDSLALREVIATTALPNLKSSAVMRRLGMVGPKATFEHPGVPLGSPLKVHALYRISRSEWQGHDG